MIQNLLKSNIFHVIFSLSELFLGGIRVCTYIGTEALASEYGQAKATLEANDTYIQVHVYIHCTCTYYILCADQMHLPYFISRNSAHVLYGLYCTCIMTRVCSKERKGKSKGDSVQNIFIGKKTGY